MTLMSNALVSIVIPAYDAAAIIKPTLDAALAQTYSHVEVIVVNDGSPDNIDEVAATYASRIRYLRQPNGGVSSARNYGCAEAKGSFLLALDADDLIAPQHISNLMRALAEQPECGVAYSACAYVDETGAKNLGDIRLGQQGDLLNDFVLLRGGLPTTGVALMRRECFERMGGFDTQLNACADLDMFIRLALAGYRYAYSPEQTFFYRMIPDSMSNQVRKTELQFFALLEKTFAQPDAPQHLLEVKDEAFANGYYEVAGRYYRVGDVQAGADRLKKALAAHPAIAADIERQAQWLRWNAFNPRTPDPMRYAEFVFANLPAEARVLREQQTRIKASLQTAFAFEAFRNGDYRRAMTHVIPSIAGNPAVLGNRGFWSMSVKSALRSLFKMRGTAQPVVAKNQGAKSCAQSAQ